MALLCQLKRILLHHFTGHSATLRHLNLMKSSEAAVVLEKLSPNERFQLEVIKLHHETLLHCFSYPLIPKKMTDSMWVYMLQNCDHTEKSRLTCFRQLTSHTQHESRDSVSKEQKPLPVNREDKGKELGHLLYLNRIILNDGSRYKEMARQDGYRKIMENIDRKLVIDMDFLNEKSQWKQMRGVVDCCMSNYKRRNPYFLEICNMNSEKFPEVRQAIDEKSFPYDITDENYTDLHSKDRILYITSASPDYVEKFDPNAVYVFAHSEVHLSMNKSKVLKEIEKYGVKTGRFPYHLSKAKKTPTLSRSVLLLYLFEKYGTWNEVFQVFDSLNSQMEYRYH